jgi:predicted phosphodiesterase
MKLAIISDVHSNIYALKAAYKALSESGFDKIICLGDVVGYCANPVECIDFLVERGIETICGNHDYYTYSKENPGKIQPYAEYAIKWTQDILDVRHLSWLEKLPFTIEIAEIECIHASLECVSGRFWPYVFEHNSALFHFYMQKKTFSAGGHLHIPLLVKYSSGNTKFELLKNSVFDNLTENEKIMLNPGAIGQPRDFDSRAASVIFDTERKALLCVRTEYNIIQAQKDIIKAGLPEQLAFRLATGL